MLGESFDRAVRLVRESFAGKYRKGTEIPYVAHLLEVAALTLSAGGDERQAIAALLHDALEDVPDRITPELIEHRFGEDVLAIVEACTDGTPGQARDPESWLARKKAYVAHLRGADTRVLVVSLADKLANARAIVADARALGPPFWKRFNAGPEEQRWYYESLRSVFTERLDGHAGAEVLVEDFASTVRRLSVLAAEAEVAP